MKLLISLLKPRLIIILLLSFLVPFSSAQTFGDGVGEPLPNVTDISLYNVSGLSVSEKETEGKKLAGGLNTTLAFNQKKSESEYRFSFRIRNDGDREWILNETDQILHETLNSSWTVNKVWYNISQDYDGGVFSNGKVEWNTSKGGTLAVGEEMFAKYLVDIKLDNSSEYDQRFLVNASSNNSGSEDHHKLSLKKLGYLSLTFNDPPQTTTVTQNKTFVANGTITCLEGDCGKVNSSVRYNESNIPDTKISSGEGTPFHTVKPNERICSEKLTKNEECELIWDLNSTGNPESYHLIDFNASSEYQRIAEKNSSDREIQINTAIIISTSWDTTDFGLLDPGDLAKPALGNSDILYNLTVSEKSNKVDDLWIRSSDLTNEYRPENYSITSGNLSYSLNNNYNTANDFSNDYRRFESDLSPGTVLNMFFWIDVPKGIYKGSYNGSIFFKANLSR